MKKITIISLVLGMMLPLVSFAQEEGVNIGPVKFQVGINQFPGKNYWVEAMSKWDTGIADYKFKMAQKEEAFHVSLLSFRASTVKPILSPNISAGLEVGCEMPISSWKKEWKNAAGDTSVGTPSEYTEIIWGQPSWTEFMTGVIVGLEDPEVEYKQRFDLKERLLVVPILGKLSYTTTSPGRIKVGAGLAFGAYVINARITGTKTNTYVQDTAFWKKDEEEIIEKTISNTVCTPGGEFSLQASLPVSSRVSIGLNGSLGYIGKTSLFPGEEITTYAPTDWIPPADPKLATFEQKFEVGGLSYGGGLSINLSF